MNISYLHEKKNTSRRCVKRKIGPLCRTMTKIRSLAFSLSRNVPFRIARPAVGVAFCVPPECYWKYCHLFRNPDFSPDYWLVQNRFLPAMRRYYRSCVIVPWIDRWDKFGLWVIQQNDSNQILLAELAASNGAWTSQGNLGKAKLAAKMERGDFRLEWRWPLDPQYYAQKYDTVFIGRTLKFANPTMEEYEAAVTRGQAMRRARAKPKMQPG